MSGFILGTGSGVLVAAAVYYTLSADLAKSTAQMRLDLQTTDKLIKSSLDPEAPVAASSFVGPSCPLQPRFADTLRSRWNLAVSRAVEGVQTTDWAAAGSVIVSEGAALAQKISSQLGDASAKVGQDAKKAASDAGADVVKKVEGIKEELGGLIPASGAGAKVVAGQLGAVGGDLRGESFTGGSAAYVKGKRSVEQASGRLV